MIEIAIAKMAARNMTPTEIAEILEVSEEQVRQALRPADGN